MMNYPIHSRMILAAWLALTALACGGSFSTSDDADASNGSGGGGGSGGSGGQCTPMPGCSSSTTCSDGCNSCYCSAGNWLCTDRACIEDAGGTGGTDPGTDAEPACTPMPGCSSLTSCYDGCNTCSCFHGEWACTARACLEDAATTDAATGSCNDDNDCIFRQESGCCGACLAVTDPVPPQLGCGIACPIRPASCLCVDHRCSAGMLTEKSPCEPSRDLCSANLKCCAQCGGPDLPDAANCSSPVCTSPLWSTDGTAVCPKSP
jgi:hypothetical protein